MNSTSQLDRPRADSTCEPQTPALVVSRTPALNPSRPPTSLQVTLFKRNYHHVVSEHYFSDYKTVSRGNPNYFITYGNGKSAARVQRGLRPNGAHRWFNYFKNPKYDDSQNPEHYTKFPGPWLL